MVGYQASAKLIAQTLTGTRYRTTLTASAHDCDMNQDVFLHNWDQNAKLKLIVFFWSPILVESATLQTTLQVQGYFLQQQQYLESSLFIINTCTEKMKAE